MLQLRPNCEGCGKALAPGANLELRFSAASIVRCRYLGRTLPGFG